MPTDQDQLTPSDWEEFIRDQDREIQAELDTLYEQGVPHIQGCDYCELHPEDQAHRNVCAEYHAALHEALATQVQGEELFGEGDDEWYGVDVDDTPTTHPLPVPEPEWNPCPECGVATMCSHRDMVSVHEQDYMGRNLALFSLLRPILDFHQLTQSYVDGVQHTCTTCRYYPMHSDLVCGECDHYWEWLGM